MLIQKISDRSALYSSAAVAAFVQSAERPVMDAAAIRLQSPIKTYWLIGIAMGFLIVITHNIVAAVVYVAMLKRLGMCLFCFVICIGWNNDHFADAQVCILEQARHCSISVRLSRQRRSFHRSNRSLYLCCLPSLADLRYQKMMWLDEH